VALLPLAILAGGVLQFLKNAHSGLELVRCVTSFGGCGNLMSVGFGAAGHHRASKNLSRLPSTCTTKQVITWDWGCSHDVNKWGYDFAAAVMCLSFTKGSLCDVVCICAVLSTLLYQCSRGFVYCHVSGRCGPLAVALSKTVAWLTRPG
jgi:hypothetical protein